MEILETAIYCKEYAQILPPEYSLFAWILWFVGIISVIFIMIIYLLILKKIEKNHSKPL